MSILLRLLLESLFFALPIYIANGCASLSMSVPIIKRWKYPIDFGKSIGGKRIFGKGKTFRGLIFGTFCGSLISIVQYHFAKAVDFKIIDIFIENDFKNIVILAFLLAFGALIGDIVKSFFKRRVGIEQGRPWPLFDQLDFVAGGLAFGAIVFLPPLKVILVIIAITPLFHLGSNIIAYLAGLKDVWW